MERMAEDYRAKRNFIDSKDWSTVKVGPIRICDKTWIGLGYTVLGGVTIGEGAVIGAFSVIRRDVPPWTVVAGNPPAIIKRIES
jgi:acetyltransferase-like isoleucine patch superfamily enzyme